MGLGFERAMRYGNVSGSARLTWGSECFFFFFFISWLVDGDEGFFEYYFQKVCFKGT